ncbi:SagB/ThcOx family dehydrogenase [Candidatus Giovannonibacteria bacterium]|nr:SagB/ThcOx family dehydrogenase [Candidatus Giovannonibacteria bacterium]
MHPFFEFFNQNRPYISKDSLEWPSSWKIVDYKTYPRLPQIALPKPNLRDASLESAIINRKSEREFSGDSISLSELSALLFFGAGIVKNGENNFFHRRSHPSGGARFPIETYFAALNVDGLKNGIYHYNVLNHAAEFLLDADRDIIGKLSVYEFVKKAALVIIFTMIPERSSRKYGNFALKVGLIEAGHIAENMYLVASALKLKGSAVGNISDNGVVEKLLDIDNSSEIAFYMLAYGK